MMRFSHATRLARIDPLPTITASPFIMSSSSSSIPGPLMKADWENKPFPLGGSRVPVGMQDHSNWMDLPEVAVVPTRGEDISPAYVLAEKKRNAFGDLKKMLALLTPTVASIYKNSASRSMTKPEDTERLALIDGLISQEAARRDELLVSLKAFQSQPGLAPTESEFGATLEKILTTVPPSDCYDQPTHVTWNDMTKKLSQNLFREQSKFLEQMKAEKKKKLAEK